MAKLVRFSVSLEEELAAAFDRRNRRRGSPNRSEAARALIRECLVGEAWARARGEAVAVVSLVYDHHRLDLPRRLTRLQHDQHRLVVSATHVHLDHDHCLEVLILRGPAARARGLGERLAACRGVKHAKVFLTTTGRGLA